MLKKTYDLMALTEKEDQEYQRQFASVIGA